MPHSKLSAGYRPPPLTLGIRRQRCRHDLLLHSGFHTPRSAQDTFRSVDTATEVRAPGSKRTASLEQANSLRDLVRVSTDHEAAKTDLKETNLGQRPDSVAEEDFLPVEHVLSDFSETILVRMPSAQETSREDTEGTESPGDSAGAVKIFDYSVADCRKGRSSSRPTRFRWSTTLVTQETSVLFIRSRRMAANHRGGRKRFSTRGSTALLVR